MRAEMALPVERPHVIGISREWPAAAATANVSATTKHFRSAQTNMGFGEWDGRAGSTVPTSGDTRPPRSARGIGANLKTFESKVAITEKRSPARRARPSLHRSLIV